MAGCLPSHRHPSGKKEKVEKLVATMQAKGVKLLALDFDLTFIDIHTKGEWTDSVDALASHVRPCMRDLLAQAREKGLYVCIVTFNSRGYLIRDLLQKLYGKKAKYIYLEAASFSTARKGFPDCEYPGKEYHIRRVVEAILQEEKEKIENEEVLLLDDDMNNVTAAMDFGHRSMQVQAKEKDIDYDALDSFERMLRIAG